MHGYRRRMDEDGSPLVDQHVINGWVVTWNPDDGRYYVDRRGEAGDSRVFKEFRNAVYYAKTH